MAQATDSSVSGKVASYLSRLNPIPRLPEYTGPYKVGTVDVEIPVSDLDSPAPAPAGASEIETIQFRIFYPAQPDSEGKRITWLPAPQRDHLAAYIRFIGVGPFWAHAASYLPRHLHYTSIPVIKNAPLLEPAPLNPNGRWPTAIFSHGLGGNRNAYSQVAGSLASHGVVVVCPEHRDGSAAVSFVRIPPSPTAQAQNDHRWYLPRSPPNNKRREVPYRRIPHDATDEVHAQRDAQLRIRLWELGLVHEALLALDSASASDSDSNSKSRFANLNASTPARALEQFAAGRLHVRDPGSIIFMGHSFGAATVVQLLKSVYHADHPDVVAAAATAEPLYVPRPGSAIRAQITPRNVTILLDMWCFPLLGQAQQALFDRPLPVYADDGGGGYGSPQKKGGPGGAALLAVGSEDFFKWKEHLHASARALSPDPRAPVVEASAFSSSSSSSSSAAAVVAKKPRFFYVRKAAHLNQSDFGLLFPLLTRRVMGSEAPERALRLNLRAVLQVLRENGVPVARTSFADLVDGGGDGSGSPSASLDKLAAVEQEGEDDDSMSAERKPPQTVVDGIHDDKAILDCSGSARIDCWEYVDVVGMGRAGDADAEDTGATTKESADDGNDAAEKQEPEMASVIEPSVTNDEEAAAAVVGDVARATGAAAA